MFYVLNNLMQQIITFDSALHQDGEQPRGIRIIRCIFPIFCEFIRVQHDLCREVKGGQY